MYQADIELVRLGNGRFQIKDNSTGDVEPSYRRLSIREGNQGITMHDFDPDFDFLEFQSSNNQVYIVDFTAGVPVSPDNNPSASLSFMMVDAGEDFLLSKVSNLYCNCTCSCKNFRKADEVSKIIAFLEAADLHFEREEYMEANRILAYLNEMQGSNSCNCKCK